MVVVCLKHEVLGCLYCWQHAVGNQKSLSWRGSRDREGALRGFWGIWNVLDLHGVYMTVFIS